MEDTTSSSVLWIRRIILAQSTFHSPLKKGLTDYYKDWVIDCNENPGQRRDENGNLIQLRFATMLAKKIRSEIKSCKRIEITLQGFYSFLFVALDGGKAGFMLY